MLFVTNRVLSVSAWSKRGRPIKLDLNDNAACQHLYYTERKGPDEYIEIGSSEFFERLRTSPAEQVLLFVHGYNNLPEPNVFPLVERLQALFDTYQPGLVDIVPLIWPSRGRLQHYFTDQDSADASAFAFSRLLQRFDDWRAELAREARPCNKRINVLAHSMGNRVLRGAVEHWGWRVLRGQVPLLFRNLFMVAADVRHNTLEPDRPGRYLPAVARNVSVYHAADDMALRASKAVNPGNRITTLRMGHNGPRDLQAIDVKNVFSLDCGFFNLQYDPPDGHTYFLADPTGLPGRAFLHIAEAIKNGRVRANPDRRLEL